MPPLRQLQTDPAAFRQTLLIDADGQPARLGSKLDPWQRADFAALDAGWANVAGHAASPGPLRAYLERPRGASKTTDLAVMATWALFASRRCLRGYAAAADKDQAKLLRDAIDGLVRLNPWLAAILKVDAWKISNAHTGSTLEVLSSDAPTSYGLTPDFVIVDELTHWQNQDLWVSLFSAVAKRRHALLCIISNAGYGMGESWQWAVREAARQDPSWYFHRLDKPPSWISAAHLAEQQRLLPALAYRRLWENQWTSGSGDALVAEDIDRAVTLRGPLKQPPPGWLFVAGLDLGLTRDKAALAVVGRHVGYHEEQPQPQRKLSDAQQALIDAGVLEPPPAAEPDYRHHAGTGKLRLARLHVWTPPANGKVSIEQIEETIAELDGLLRLHAVGADPWQAAYLIERLRKRGVPIEPTDPTATNLKSMCSATLEAFAEGNIALYKEPQLLADLRGLRVVEKSYGVRLDSPRGPGGHGDAATALAIALHLLKTCGAHIARQQNTGTLICN